MGKSRLKFGWRLLFGALLCVLLSATGIFAVEAPPSCSDGIQNQDEVQVDCGGAVCLPCNPFPLTLSATSVPAGAVVFTIATEAAAHEAPVSFLVFRDFNGNGQIDPEDWPIQGDDPAVVVDDGLSSDPYFSADKLNPDDGGVALETDFNLGGVMVAPGSYILVAIRGEGGAQAAVPFSVTPESGACQVIGTADDGSDPIQGAMVALASGEGMNQQLVATAYSDDNGEFTLEVPEVNCNGSGGLMVSAPGYIDTLRQMLAPISGSEQPVSLPIADTNISGTVKEYVMADGSLINPQGKVEVWAVADMNPEGDVYKVRAWADEVGSYSLPIHSEIDWRVRIGQKPVEYFDALTSSHGYQPFAFIDRSIEGPWTASFNLYRQEAAIGVTVLAENGLPVVATDVTAQRLATGTPAIDNLVASSLSNGSGQAEPPLSVNAGGWSIGHFPPGGQALVDGASRELVPGPRVTLASVSAGTGVVENQANLTAYFADGALEGCVFESDGTTPAPYSRVVAYADNPLNGVEQAGIGTALVAAVSTGIDGCFRLPLLGGSWMVAAYRPVAAQESLMQSVVLVTDGDESIESENNEVQSGLVFSLYQADALPDDLDGDGIPDNLDGDIDGDGLPNDWETQYSLNPNDATGVNGAAGDPDKDTFSNLTEYTNDTNPRIYNTAVKPTWIEVPASSSTGSIRVYWGTSGTPGATFIVEESYNSGTYTEVYSGPGRDITLTSRANGSYTYRVKVTKDGWHPSAYTTGTVTCVVSIVTIPPPKATAVGPTWIYVPASSTTGSIRVYWGTTGTAGSTFVTEESFSGGAYAQVYSGALRDITLTNRANGSYAYRVRVIKDGMNPSPYASGTQPCVVNKP